MRIGIDAREIQEGVYTGIGRPLVNFLEYFDSLNNEDSCVLFSNKKIPIHFSRRITNVVLRPSMTWIWDQYHLPLAIKQHHIDVFYSPYYKIPLLKSCKQIAAILDVMYLTFSPYYHEMSILKRLYYSTFGKAFAKSADRILTCSEYSKKEICKIYGIGADKIKVIPLSVGELYFSPKDPSRIEEIKKKFSIHGPYILYMGNFKLHKNVPFLIHAFASIALDFPDLNLVLAGPMEHTYRDLLKIVKGYNLEKRVIFTGKIMEFDGPQYLYQGAEVFVMPSLYEGFGLPPVEAMACAVPVVASGVTSIPEVVSDAGILVNPDHATELAGAIKKILQDASLRKVLIEKGLRQAKQYQPKDVAQQMYDFLKSI
jgi:glycosyltransferase involved in cell wall biosynthesis